MLENNDLLKDLRNAPKREAFAGKTNTKKEALELEKAHWNWKKRT